MTITWTIAGSDSSGGAGIQADLHTFQSFGIHGCSVITAVTAQNSLSIDDIHFLPAAQIHSQLNALKNDLPTNAIKLGMMGNASIIHVVRSFLQTYSGYVVLDPVLISNTGHNLFFSHSKEYLSSIKSLFEFVDILTPNLNEVELLLDCKISSYDDIEEAANKLLALGIKSVFIKGGHFKEDIFSQDYWTNAKESFWVAGNRYPHIDVHGTGCTLSSAITACLALGYDIKDALVIAKMYVSQSIRSAKFYSKKLASIIHKSWPENQEDLPFLSLTPIKNIPDNFPNCGQNPIGLYPIVDNIIWLEKLLSLGITTIQLRIKDKSTTQLENHIQQAVKIANKYQARLFINDYWELALRFGAYGLHLGQQDINHANINKIRNTGLRLGISTHCYYEVARAHVFKPSYIACGPIFPTTSKIMPFAPQGISQLERWRRTLNYPIVAIGGINLERLPSILMAGADGIAMISAITEANNPENMTQQLLNKYHHFIANHRDISV